MPLHRKPSTSNPSATAIDKFIEYRETNRGSSVKRMNLRNDLGNSGKLTNSSSKQAIIESSLNQIVYYLMCSKNLSQGCLTGTADAVLNLRNYCDTTIPAVRTQFLNALTTACAEFFDDASLKNIIKEAPSASKIVAAFHKASESHIVLDLNIDQLAEIPEAKREVIIFCIKSFVPELVISGHFVDAPEKLTLLNEVMDVYKVSTSLTYKDCNLGKIDAFRLPAFLSTLSKASKLSLKDAALDQWSDDHFIKLVLNIRANPQLTSLDLEHTHLDRCCNSFAKFQCLLELISLPQFKTINLHANHLSNLPAPQMKQLKDAINSSKPGVVQLHLKEKKKESLRDSNLFATTIPIPTPVPHNSPATPKSLVS